MKTKEEKQVRFVCNVDEIRRGRFGYVENTDVTFVVVRQSRSKIGKVMVGISHNGYDTIDVVHYFTRKNAKHVWCYPVEFDQCAFGPECWTILRDLGRAIDEHWDEIPNNLEVRENNLDLISDCIKGFINNNKERLESEGLVETVDGVTFIEKNVTIYELNKELSKRRETRFANGYFGMCKVYERCNRLKRAEDRLSYRSAKVLHGKECFGLVLN